MSDDPQDRIAQAWTDAVGQTIAGLSDSDYAEMLSRFRPQAAAPPTPVDESNLPVTRRSDFRARVDQLWDITQQCIDGNGYTRGMSDAAAARAKPVPQPEPPAPQGFGVINRGQDNAGSGTSPEPPRAPRHLR